MVKSKVIPIIDQPNIAVIIPARGGSKEIPLKNLRDFCGKPLIAHSILAAKNAKTSLRIFVSTDHLEIARIARQYGAEVIDRPMAYASDTATSESALIHALKAMHKVHQYKPDVIIFLQPTSPLRRPWDLDAALSTYFESGVDSLFSVFRFSRLLWRHTSTKLTSFNYDYKKRPRRQDRDPEFVESGSIYIFKPDLLTKQSNRLGGTIGYYEQDHWSGFEIDTLDDWELAEWVYRRHFQNEGAQNVNLSQLRMVVFDFDGVFTDNKVLTLSDGTEAVLCDRSDGLKLKELKNHDLHLIRALF